MNPSPPISPQQSVVKSPVSKQVARNTSNPVWLHPNITNAAAEALLGRSANGTFIVRKRVSPSEYVLSVNDGGYVTHRSVSPDLDGYLVIEGKSYGDQHSIYELLDALRLPRSDWTPQLRAFVPNSEASTEEIAAEKRFIDFLLEAYNTEDTRDSRPTSSSAPQRDIQQQYSPAPAVTDGRPDSWAKPSSTINATEV